MAGNFRMLGGNTVASYSIQQLIPMNGMTAVWSRLVRQLSLVAICAFISKVQAQSPFGGAQEIYSCEPQSYILSSGDLDGDQITDLIVAMGDQGQVVWYKNSGSGEMGARRSIRLAGSMVTALVSGNVTNDQSLDIVFVTAPPSTITVLSNNGSGNIFSLRQTLAVTGHVSSIILADIDGNLDNDLVWTSSATGSIEASLYDSPAFGAPMTINELEGAHHLRTADMDGDGDLDLVCSSSVTGDLTILTNDGSGSFDPSILLETSLSSPWWFDIADVRNDGDPDVIAPGGGATWYDNMNDGTGFVPRAISGTTTNAWRAFASGTNSDGRTVLLTTYENQNGSCDTRSATIFEDDQYSFHGSGYSPCFNLPLVLSHPNGGAETGLVFSTGFLNKIVWYTLLGSNIGTQYRIEGDPFYLPHQLRLADMDGDGDQDVTGIPFGARMVWFANDGGGVCNGHYSPFWSDQSTNGIDIADLDGDGDPEQLARYYSNGSIHLARNEGALGFQYAGVVGQVDEWTADFAAGDVDGDGDNDLLISPPSNMWGTELRWLANDGTGQLTVTHTVGEAPNAEAIFVRDMNGDGLNDIVCPLYYYPAGVAIYFADSPGSFPAIPETTLLGNGAGQLKAPVCTDLNGDTYPDLIAHCAISNGTYRILPFLNDGNGSLIVGDSIPVASFDLSPIAISDFDGDQLVDMVLGEVDMHRIRFFRGTGNAEFAEPVLIDSMPQIAPGSLAVADMDLDGDVDLVAVRDSPCDIVWYENSLFAPTIAPAPSAGVLYLTPNPMSDQLQIMCTQPFLSNTLLQVFDVQGRIIRSIRGNGTNSITLARGDLAAGVYVVYAQGLNAVRFVAE